MKIQSCFQQVCFLTCVEVPSQADRGPLPVIVLHSVGTVQVYCKVYLIYPVLKWGKVIGGVSRLIAKGWC